MKKKRFCPHDGSIMRRDIRPFTASYKGHSGTINMPGWSCDKCGERIFNSEDMDKTDQLLYRLKIEAEGLLGPADIRRIRKKLKLSQKKAGELIGGGPRAFQKYESGNLLPSRAISSVLRLLDRDPAALAILKVPPHGQKLNSSHARPRA